MVSDFTNQRPQEVIDLVNFLEKNRDLANIKYIARYYLAKVQEGAFTDEEAARQIDMVIEDMPYLDAEGFNGRSVLTQVSLEKAMEAARFEGERQSIGF